MRGAYATTIGAANARATQEEAAMAGDAWRKSSPELVERFEAATAGIDGLERRQMFGYPAGFVGGNMVTGLHQESWIVRLPEAERTPRLDAGWRPFEPMAGRPMREYLALPAEVASDPEAARAMVELAADYVRTLPIKVPKPRRATPRTRPAGG
jgi:TfoX/Sxy family transcriptional regulator of competence genes